MVEKLRKRSISPIEIMRYVASNYDDNMVVHGTENEELVSDGISMLLLGEKARLLSGIQFGFTSGVPSSSDALEQENIQLRNENLVLRDMIRRIEERLSRIEASLSREKVIVLREISREEAKEEIRRLFSSGKTFYYSDIAQELGLDLEMVVGICNELQKQGEIGVDGGAS